MKAKILKTEQEYKEACERFYSISNSTEDAIDQQKLLTVAPIKYFASRG
jgi:hypothetical protein